MKKRWNNLFKPDGKAFIIAFDHGRGGRMDADPADVINKAVEGGVDGILTTYGVIKNFKQELSNLGVILRMDLTASALAPRTGVPDLAYTVEEAARLGVDGAMLLGFPSGEYDYEMTRNIARLVAECDKYGLISSAEMLPNGFSNDPADRTIEKMKIACRQAAELGIDFVKTEYVGPVDQFNQVVNNCYVPILVLGGGTKPDREILQYVKDSIDSGCKGLVMGRNVWKHPNVLGMCKAMNSIVHGNATVDEAMEILGS